ncbi:biopolymer transporter ExbD [Sinimarinibacterium sp. NLF-5-8]|uniref:biopolymer transporter ExbD n=1 Tax=Sinimarinibacterium sp. NLF-5-8 TaxID=2698684 RepID=UPI00137C3959|nr:biopolymer transporter ExbD [Sinimarinibacterium sp. NLF-5-8]QHS09578.1 hypothetical protein GT972_04975 [Sinimarinibacterium sp. NLF-5-8]
MRSAVKLRLWLYALLLPVLLVWGWRQWQPPQPLRVVLISADQLRVNGQPLSWSAWQHELSRMDTAQPIVIQVDAHQPSTELVALMQMLHARNLQHVTVVTTP